jgi:hypothetical protein
MDSRKEVEQKQQQQQQNGESVVINELNLTRKKSILKKKSSAAKPNLSLTTPKNEAKKVLFNNIDGLPNIISPEPFGRLLKQAKYS